MDVGQLIAAITSGAAMTAFGAVLNGWIKARSDAAAAQLKVKSEVDLAQDAQEFNQQTQIISDLRHRIEYLERANAECVSDRSELRHKVGHLEGRLDEQGRSMQHLRATTAEQARDVVQRAGEVAAEGVKAAALVASDSAVRLLQQTAKATDNKLTDHDIQSAGDSVHS